MINRQKLINPMDAITAINDFYDMAKYKGAEFTEQELLSRIKGIITSQPPADKWIPCSERLPDEDGEYLVWYECGEDEDDEKGFAIVPFWTDLEMFGVYQDIFDSQTLGFVDSEFYECETAIAWMPLPEPYTTD